MTRAKKEGGFSFRELESFNTAILGKMASRILKETDSLGVKVLKGLYFPQVQFLHVVKRSGASWT